MPFGPAHYISVLLSMCSKEVAKACDLNVEYDLFLAGGVLTHTWKFTRGAGKTTAERFEVSLFQRENEPHGLVPDGCYDTDEQDEPAVWKGEALEMLMAEMAIHPFCSYLEEADTDNLAAALERMRDGMPPLLTRRDVENLRGDGTRLMYAFLPQ